MAFNEPMATFSENPPDPASVSTVTELRTAMRQLYKTTFRTLAEAATQAGLSVATVHNLVNADHPALPTADTLNKFVSACGQDVGPWLATRNRIHDTQGKRGPNRRLNARARRSLAELLNTCDSDRRHLQDEAVIFYARVRAELADPGTRLAFLRADGSTTLIELLFH